MIQFLFRLLYIIFSNFSSFFYLDTFILSYLFPASSNSSLDEYIRFNGLHSSKKISLLFSYAFSFFYYFYKFQIFPVFLLIYICSSLYLYSLSFFFLSISSRPLVSFQMFALYSPTILSLSYSSSSSSPSSLTDLSPLFSCYLNCPPPLNHQMHLTYLPEFQISLFLLYLLLSSPF